MTDHNSPTPVAATTSAGPLIVACLRHSDHRPNVDPVTARVDRDCRGATATAAEWAALEHALRIAEAWRGHVLAVCAGPPDADRTLREAAAVGAQVMRIVLPGVQTDGGPHLDLEPLEVYLNELASDGRGVAEFLAAAIRAVGEPDLVICGDRSVDRGTGSVPAFLAAQFGAAQALGLVRVQVDGPDLIGDRRLDRGRRERLRIPRPAVVSVEASGLHLRRAETRACLAAARLAIPVFQPTSLVSALRSRDAVHSGPTDQPAGCTGIHRCPPKAFRPRAKVVPAPRESAPRERLTALTSLLVPRKPPTLVHPRSAAEAADTLLDYLGTNGYLPS